MRLSNDELWEKAGTDQPITMEDIGLEKETTTVIKNRNGLTIFCPYCSLKGNSIMIGIFIFLIIILLSVCFGALLAKYL